MNARMRMSVVLMIGCLGLMLGQTTRADMVYTDQASFLANLQPGYYLETFDSLPQGMDIGPALSFSQSGFGYTASVFYSNIDGFWNEGPDNDVWLSTDFEGDPIVFQSTSGFIEAVGGYFFPSDIDGNLAPGTITLTLDDGTSYSVTNPSDTTFVGFIASAPISSLTVSTDSNWVTVNDFIVGASTVPEPSTLVLSVTGAALGLAVGLANRRARRRVRFLTPLA